ncbi:MAG: peptidylprolyl isomerase [Flaviaesturariibacter sp.]|nr:peptidylprolyl isomerase [Flaviaesturariibacter sp.]
MKGLLLLLATCFTLLASAQKPIKLKKKDRRRDIELVTTAGTILLRLSDSTPFHRDNFLRQVKAHYYDSILFHRVIKGFMIQAGDAATKGIVSTQPRDSTSARATIPAEILTTLHHHKGALAAAREGDNVNPEKRSSPYQFYIVQGRTFTDAEMDSVEKARLFGRKIPAERRQLYRTIGGTPQLDGNYTVFGKVVNGLDVVDRIATTSTSQSPRDRPVTDVRIVKMRLVKRKKAYN